MNSISWFELFRFFFPRFVILHSNGFVIVDSIVAGHDSSWASLASVIYVSINLKVLLSECLINDALKYRNNFDESAFPLMEKMNFECL